MRLASRFYLTYFLLDLRLRLRGSEEIPLRRSIELLYSERWLSEQQEERFHSAPADGIERDLVEQNETVDLRHTIDIFKAILSQWQQSVEANGARFYVVLLPRPTETLFTHFVDGNFNVINLYARFGAAIDGYDYDKDVRFKNDGHWNEVGNLLAAIELYRVLERDGNLPTMPNEKLSAAVRTYYGSFPEGWTPPRQWVASVAVPPEVRSAIRNKYIALEPKSH